MNEDNLLAWLPCGELGFASLSMHLLFSYLCSWLWKPGFDFVFTDNSQPLRLAWIVLWLHLEAYPHWLFKMPVGTKLFISKLALCPWSYLRWLPFFIFLYCFLDLWSFWPHLGRLSIAQQATQHDKYWLHVIDLKRTLNNVLPNSLNNSEDIT